MNFKVLFLVCWSCLLFSQNNIRFTYEYRYAVDSTKIDSVYTETMYLDISKDESVFYSRDVFVGDSLMSNAIRGIEGRGGVVKIDRNMGRIRDVIKKTYPNFDIITTTNVGLDKYVYEDERKINWTITNETKTIEGIQVQKSTAKAFGRNWTAWFSSSYPFPDGPYKFHGLPGIIVMIEDQNKGHVFSLKGIKILKDEELALVNDKKEVKKPINITREQYKKVFLTQRENPLKDWRPRMGGAVRLQATYNGKPMDSKDIEKHAKARLKKENNLLEIDLVNGKK